MAFEGEVKWFNNERGFGFIHPVVDNSVDENVEYFVHFSSINTKGFKTLKEKQKVIFDIQETDKGIQAVNVSLVK